MKAHSQQESLIKINTSYEGEPIEREVEKLLAGEVELEATGSPIYTKKADGVLPEYDIRTDRFAIGQDAMGKINIQRMNYQPWLEKSEGEGEGEGEGEATTAE